MRNFFWSQDWQITQQLMFLLLQFVPQISLNLSFFLDVVRIPALTFLLLLRKKKRNFERYINYRSLNYCLFRETTTTPAQTVAAANSHEEKPSSILATYCCPSGSHSIFDTDYVVTFRSGNGKRSRKQRILTGFTVYDGSFAGIALLFFWLMKVVCFSIGKQ